MERQRAHVVFRGEVQGVGFRYTARRIAARFAVTGWVRNEYDGSVELEAQGERAEVEAFVGSISAEMSDNIRETLVTWGCARDGEAGFSIAH